MCRDYATRTTNESGARTRAGRLIIDLHLCRENQTNVEGAVYNVWNETHLVSPVSFLNEKPSRAIFLPVTVLKRQSIILQANLRLWYSFISITCERRHAYRGIAGIFFPEKGTIGGFADLTCCQ